MPSIMRWVVMMAVLGVATPVGAREDRVSELERKVDALTRKTERLESGAVPDTTIPVPRSGVAPARVSIGGYGEMLLERFDHERQDGTGAGRPTQIDFVRNVLEVGYRFDDRLRFDSGIELEHAAAGGAAAGRVALEFACLDWALRCELGIRAGMLLVPVGLVNEWHEPPDRIGARRPDVEQRIIPTTWRAIGAGLFGELPVGLAYRAYLTEGLDASRFSAADGIRDGRQDGSEARAVNPAFSGRLDWIGTPGLRVGVSAYTGDSWQAAQPASGGLEPQVTLADLHARFDWRGLKARSVFVRGWLDDAGDLSDALGLTGSARLGQSFWGYYVETTYDVLPLAYPGTPYGLLPYARFERTDTQDDVPAGIEDPANDRTTLTTGLAFKPHPNVVLEVDHEQRRNQARTGVGQWNAAIGYRF
jgi:hypothetical protein